MNYGEIKFKPRDSGGQSPAFWEGEWLCGWIHEIGSDPFSLPQKLSSLIRPFFLVKL